MVTLFRLARLINFIKRKMDEKELDEGMTWKELHQVLKEKDKAEKKEENKDEINAVDEVGSSTPCTLRSAPCERSKYIAVTWASLILLLFEERSFFSLRKDSGGRISVSKENSSKRVLDCFFERAWQRSILKSFSSFI
jgi:hypothetical protein